MQEPKLKNLAEAAQGFLKSFDRLENYRQFCSEQVSDCDKMLSDLDHKLEFHKLDAVKRGQLVAKRKSVLDQRRMYKDEIERALAIISKVKDTQTLHNQIQAACNELKATNQRLDNRTYTPRILYEDFGVSEEEKKKIEQRKADIQKFSRKSKSGNIHRPSKKVLDLEEKFREIANG